MGHEAIAFSDQAALLAWLNSHTCDGLLLDSLSPNGASIPLMSVVRKKSGTRAAILLVTNPSSELRALSGLHAGADDYVMDDVSDAVFDARLKSLLRSTLSVSKVDPLETWHDHVFNLQQRKITVLGSPASTTAREFALALLLFRNLGVLISRREIVYAVWGCGADTSSRTLDAHISQIRNKLSLKPGGGYLFSSVHRFGYRLERLINWERTSPEGVDDQEPFDASGGGAGA